MSLPPAARRYAFSGLERFSRLLGMLVGFTLSTALIPIFILYAFREMLTADLRALLALLVLASLLLAALLRRWLSTEDSGVYVVEGHVVVKLGRLFEAAVPIAAVAEVEPAVHPWWMGAGVKLLGRGRVAVVTSTKGVVELRFREPVPLRLMPLVRVKARALRLSLEEAPMFAAELESYIEEGS